MVCVNKVRYFSPPAIIWQKPCEFTNEDAINILGKELEKSGMKADRVNVYLEFVKSICKKLNIQEKNLPINDEHRGNLTEEESFSVYEKIFNATILDEIV
ncbi:MAG: hypothetical protein MJ229_05355 [bacterium]|nr:hypothetical protein [bacterium]